MEDWDLQAVVRGCSTSDQAFASIMNNPQQPPLFSHPSVIDQEDDLILSDFPMVFEPRSSTCDSDGLEGLFKPFYPVFHQVALSPQSIISSTTTVSVPSTDKLKLENIPKNKQHISETSGVTSASCSDISRANKWKRRKNDQKRVVKQVTADGLSSDMWAWRKYGQKPIKGSPYPRSYYRCSSLKGCLARKQVERSSSDPSIFIVTYTSEHGHAHPPRRNALAGSTRTKSKKLDNNKLPVTPSKDVSSPTTPSLASINSNEDELAQNNVTNRIEDEEILEAAQENNHHFMQDFMFSDDDLYPSLEDLNGLLFN